MKLILLAALLFSSPAYSKPLWQRVDDSMDAQQVKTAYPSATACKQTHDPCLDLGPLEIATVGTFEIFVYFEKDRAKLVMLLANEGAGYSFLKVALATKYGRPDIDQCGGVFVRVCTSVFRDSDLIITATENQIESAAVRQVSIKYERRSEAANNL